MAKNPLRTRLCEMLDIEYPIILAGMGGFGGPVSGPELVAAVSNAGGLGVLGCAFLPPNKIQDLIRQTRSLTDKPFGVDTVLPAEVPESGTTTEFKLELPEQATKQTDFVQKLKEELGIPEPQKKEEVSMSDIADDTVWSGDLFKEQIEVIIEERVPVYAAGLGDPGPWVDECHRRGMKVISVVGHTRAARRVAKSGVDIVVAQGIESGGHTSRVATLPLIPQVVDTVAPIPVVAAGGIGDGRGLVAALALGAVGVWCGTVFVATYESIYEDYLKERIVNETEDDTVVSRVITGKQARYMKNRLIAAWEKAGLPTLPMPMQPIVILPILDAAWEAKIADIVPAPAGQICGLIKQLKPAGQVVEEMVQGALQTLEGLSTR
jgi:NAD(P)H-dependent flavin oxidoreductase YrpB (nitropropane dioxygenase family)